MIVKRRLLGLAALVILNVCPVCGFILNDSFEDGNRTIQNPPESVAYFTSMRPSALKEADGVLTLQGGGNRFLIAAVGEAGDYITLNDGEALSLEMTFRLEGEHVKDNKQLRLAWFNSGEKPGDRHLINQDRFENSSPLTRDFRGYQAGIALWSGKSSAKPIQLAKRARSEDDLLIKLQTGGGGYVKLGEGGVGQIADGELNTVQFYLRRIGQVLEVGAIFVPGGPAAGNATDFFHKEIDDDNPFFRFDYFVIGLNADDGSVRRIDIESLRIFKAQ